MINYATNLALIDKNTSIVRDIIWGMIYDKDGFADDDTYVIVSGDLRIIVGDYYDGKNFYHNGNKVKSREEELEEALLLKDILLQGGSDL